MLANPLHKFFAMSLSIFCLFTFLSLYGVEAQNRLWTRMIGYSNGDNYANAVAVDNNGAVFMAGTGNGPGSLHEATYVGSSDIVLLKFSTNGTRIWTKIDGTEDEDEAYAVAVDGRRSSVYVAGFSMASLHGQTYVGSHDIVLLKYASNGTRIWTRQIGTSGTDLGYGVAVDPSGDGAVYLSGGAAASLHGQTYAAQMDFILIKYAINGTRLWTRMLGTGGSDFGSAIAVDVLSGSVYVCGNAQNTLHGQTYLGGSGDMLLVKYASNGTRVWTRMAGTTAYDTGKAVALDVSNDAIYITGSVGGSLYGDTYAGQFDIVLVKFSLNGTRVWTRQMGSAGYDSGLAVAVDTTNGPDSGAVYLSGYSAGSLFGLSVAGNEDFFLSRYSSNGTRVWTTMNGTTSDDESTGLAVDVDGTIFMSGYAAGSLFAEAYFPPGLNMFLSNYRSTPVIQSVSPTGRPSSQPSSQPSKQPTSKPSEVYSITCRQRTFRQVSSQTEFTKHQCFAVPSATSV